MKNNVIVYGYSGWFAVKSKVKISFNGEQIGCVSYNDSLEYNITEDGILEFICNMRKNKINVYKDRLNIIRVEFNRVTGSLLLNYECESLTNENVDISQKTYCNNCGKDDDKVYKYCTNCGNKMNRKDKFCRECGYNDEDDKDDKEDEAIKELNDNIEIENNINENDNNVNKINKSNSKEAIVHNNENQMGKAVIFLMVSIVLAFVIIPMIFSANSGSGNGSKNYKEYTYRGCYNYSSYTICRWIIINGSNCYLKSGFSTNYSDANKSGDNCSLSETTDGKIKGVTLWTDNALKSDYYSFNSGVFTYNNGDGDFHSSISRFVMDVKK